MWRIIVSSVVLLSVISVAGLVQSAASAAPEAVQEQAKLRVGVYDSRAIAVAYVHSPYSPTSGKMKEYEEAKAAGDEARVKELEAWGEKHQRQLHRQGFGRVPVSDLLEHVKDRLPELAEQIGVDVIAFECNYLGPNVEEVDITVELAKLFDDSERTLETIEQLRQMDPLDLDEIEAHHDDH